MDPVRQEEPAGAGGARAAAARQRGGAQGSATGQGADGLTQTANGDAVIGEQFRTWFNDKVRQLPSPLISLGTKQAHAIALHEDGRLECVFTGVEGEGAIQFVAFEAKYLGQLIPKIGALGL